MTLAITMARNEADIIGRTVRKLKDQGCRVIVADHFSIDDTARVARAAGAEVVPDTEPAYRQGDKMTALAHLFAHQGEWVIPFDADEVWTGIPFLRDDYDIATAAPHVHTKHDRRALSSEPQPKVAFRWRPGARIAIGNHGVEGAGDRVEVGVLSVCHYQYRSLEQVRRKVRQGVAAFDLEAAKTSYGSHWRELAALDDAGLEAWWQTYQDQQTVRCPLSAL